MTHSPSKPAVTLYLMAYNQSRFIRQAIEGAFRQTYSPLQIVLSDDCSTDETFQIMEELAAEYAGRHTILLNRNEHNLGISEHLNRIMALATGDLIVAADGDDISQPHRVQRSVEVWLERGRPSAIASSVVCIDAHGRPSSTQKGHELFDRFLPAPGESRDEALKRFLKEGSPRLASCSAAWTKELFDAFGPLPSGLWYEDDIMTLRAWLYDRIEFVEEPLINYREHEANVFNRVPTELNTAPERHRAEETTSLVAQRRRAVCLSYFQDLEIAEKRGWISEPMHGELVQLVSGHCRRYQVVEDWWNMSWPSRFLQFVTFLSLGNFRDGRWCSPRLLPLRIFVAAAAVWARRRGIPPLGTLLTSISLDGWHSFIAS